MIDQYSTSGTVVYYIIFDMNIISNKMNKKKILIIDDEPDILEFLSYNFRKKDFNVFTANNGLEGLKNAEVQSPDIIISDILMPEMYGIEMCK